MSELAVTALADRPRPRGGPSAVKCSKPPETKSSLVIFSKRPVDRPHPKGEPFAVQPSNPTREATSVDKFHQRPADRPPFNSLFYQRQNLSLDDFGNIPADRPYPRGGPSAILTFSPTRETQSLDEFTSVWWTVRPTGLDRPHLGSQHKFFKPCFQTLCRC